MFRLQHLPSSLQKLSLKAVWLSENQGQPLLQFQTDWDAEGGQEVLTCFLLPQLDDSEPRGEPMPTAGHTAGQSLPLLNTDCPLLATSDANFSQKHESGIAPASQSIW